MARSYEYPLKDYLNSINLKQGDLSEDTRAMSKYPAFVINKCMAQHVDTVIYANEMNMHGSLDNDLQYLFYLYSIRKSKRFSPWNKKTSDSDLALVKKYFGYNTEKARQALTILNTSQIDFIKSKLDTGGKR